VAAHTTICNQRSLSISALRPKANIRHIHESGEHVMAEAYLGEIRMFAGNYAPQNWAMCDGTLLPVSGNEALFSLISTTYGGDGVSNFALPDLRSRLPANQGQGPGLTARVIGQSFGSETVTLAVNQYPVHSHNFIAATNAASQTTPSGNFLAAPAPANVYLYAAPDPTKKTSNMAGDMIGMSGQQQAQPHNNMMPSLSIAFIICLNGTYPSHQ
jgi:microcystin-dependent protein